MKKNIITSIDIGTSAVRCVIAKHGDTEGSVHILGVGSVPSLGMRRGSVVDVGDAASAVASAVEHAEEMSGEQVTHAIVSIGGTGVSIGTLRGVVAVGRADGEVTEDDVERALASAQTIMVPTNKEIIHVIPRTFRLDDQEDIKDPVGLKGVRLEVEAVVIEVPRNAVRDLRLALERADIDVDDIVVEPLAAAEAALTKRQKELGVALVCIGASTTSLAVYEEGEIIHTAVIPVGADFITHDLAIGLRTSIDVAEKIKIAYGSAKFDAVKRTDEIVLSEFDPREDGAVLHDHIIEIVVARLEEVFALVRKELVKIDKDQLLPAGIVLTGGGTHLADIVDFAKDALQLPVQVGYPEGLLGMMDQVDSPSHTTAVGLLMWRADRSDPSINGGGYGTGMMHKVSYVGKEGVANAKKFFGRFLP